MEDSQHIADSLVGALDNEGRAKHAVQSAVCLPSMHKVLVAHAYSRNTQEVEGGGAKPQGHSQLQRAFEAVWATQAVVSIGKRRKDNCHCAFWLLS